MARFWFKYWFKQIAETPIKSHKNIEKKKPATFVTG